VPSPVGLVVKNGWNNFSLTSGNADAVVAYPDLDLDAEIARRHSETRLELGVVRVVAAIVCGVEAVAEQVQKHPSNILRHQLERERCCDRDPAPV